MIKAQTTGMVKFSDLPGTRLSLSHSVVLEDRLLLPGTVLEVVSVEANEICYSIDGLMFYDRGTVFSKGVIIDKS